MGVDMVEFGVKLRRITIVSIRKSYKIVCNHPFLLGMLLYLLFLYRSFPFLFSLLVSTSPVLVCTAFLLGFLLSLGDPNVSEYDKETGVNHEIVSLRTEVQRDRTIVEQDGFVVERYSGNTSRDEVENLVVSREDSVDRIDGGLVNTGPLIEDYFESERRKIDGVVGELLDLDRNERKNDETMFLENQYSRIEEMDEESVGLLYSKSPMGSVGSDRAERGDSPPASPWKQFGEGDDDVADEDSDSSSDRAESSSPDASMADILPLLDDLQPFLNEEKTPLVTQLSDHSSRGYKEIPSDSGEESETHDDVDDDDERDDLDGAKDDEAKPEITWTEDDQKNLMDLGTLELERNQRLESLIARRRARKLLVEKNLIDLNYELPFAVPPISTLRKNPFDLPYDSYEGLPPIPGSAPSIMSNRRNPFDLPYDSSEEKPDLTTDSFQQEFSPLPSRETMFRRHESFNVGPSIFAPPRFGRDDFQFRPYFVPEGSSGNSSFRRQTSELSDVSRISSVPDTEVESICSIGDQDDKNIVEGEISGDIESPDQDDKKIDEENDLENVEVLDQHGNKNGEDEILRDVEIPSQDDKKIVDDNTLEDVEIGSDLEDPSQLVGHGSESSEDEDHVTELGRLEMREIKHHEREMPNATLLRALSTIEEVHYSSGSSSSSLSGEHEIAFNEEKRELLTSLELDIDEINDHADEIKEPVYDLSPSSDKKNLSCSSVLSDMLVEQTSEMDETVVSFSDRQIDFCTQTSSNEVIVKNEEKMDRLGDQDQSNEHEDVHASSVSLSLNSQYVKTLVQNDLVEEHSVNEDVVLQRTEDHIHSSSSNVYSKWVSVEKPMDELHTFDKPIAEFSEELLEHSTMHLESIAEDNDEDSTLSDLHQLDQVTAGTLVFQSDEALSSQVQEPDFIEGEENDDMDEGLLMELDNVNDFSIGGLESGLNEMRNEDIESILLRTEPVPMKNEAEMSSRMIVFDDEEVKFDLDAPLVVETEADCNQIGEETEIKNVCKPIIDDTIISDEIDSGMHGIDATLVQVINRDVKQDDEMPVIVNSLESLPEDIGAEVAEISEEKENYYAFNSIHNNEIGSGIHELEATSVQDMDMAIAHIIDDDLVIVDSVESLPENIEGGVAEIDEKTEVKPGLEPFFNDEIDSEMHGLEATSLQDMDTTIKQIINDENRAIADLVYAELLPEMIEAEIGEETKNKTVLEIDSGVHELEAVSYEDTNAFNDKETENPILVDSHTESSPAKNEAEVTKIGEESDNKFTFDPVDNDKIDSGVHDLEATSTQDIDTGFKQKNNDEISIGYSSVLSESLPENVEAEVAGFCEETENKTVLKFDSGMHELEATSIQDIDAAFKQINNKGIEKSLIAHAESLPEISEAEVAEIIEETENKTVFEPILHDEISSAIRELEVTSAEDINAASRQVYYKENENPVIGDAMDAETSQENEETHYEDNDIVESLDVESLPEDRETENRTVTEKTHYSEIDSVMDEQEATSIQDIDAVFRLINRKENEDNDIVESLDAESLPEKLEAEVSETEALETPFVEARTTEDIDMDFKEHNVIERYSSSFSEFFDSYIIESEDKAEFFEANFDDASSQKSEIENSAVLEPIQEEEISSAMEQLEAQSLEDLNSDFSHIKEEIDNPVILESLEAVAVPESESRGPEIEIPELPVVKVRSSEDICDIDKNSDSISKSDTCDSLESGDQTEEISSTMGECDSNSVNDIDTDIGQIKEVENLAVFEQVLAEERELGIKEFEAWSPEELQSAFEKIDREETQSSVIVASLETDLVSENSELDFPERETIDLEKEDLKARSLENNDTTFKPIKEEEFENPVDVASFIADLAPEESAVSVSEIETQEMAVIEASSIEVIGLALKQIDECKEISSSNQENNDAGIIESKNQEEKINAQLSEDTDVQLNRPAVFVPLIDETVDLETKDIETRSLEDINRSFRHIKNDEVEKPINIASLLADLVPDKSKAGISEIEAPEFSVNEERTIEDIGLTHLHESEKNSNSISENEKPVFVEAEYQTQETEDIDTSYEINEVQKTLVFEPVNAEENSSGMKDLEAQSLEDIESAFKRFQSEEIEKPMVIQSLKAEISDSSSTENEPSPETIKMDLLAIESRSIEYVSDDKPSNETEVALELSPSLQVVSANKPKSLLEEAETSIEEPVIAQNSGSIPKEVKSSAEISSLPDTSAKENEPKIETSSAPLETEGINSTFPEDKDNKNGKSLKSKSSSSSSSCSSSSSSDSD